MKKTILKATLVSTLLANSALLANDDAWLYSIGANVGVSNISNSQSNTNGVITLLDKPEKSFNSIEVFTTLKPLSDICKEYDMKPYISYTYASNSDLKHQYLLLGINKYYKPSTSKVELYGGVLGGYGQMDWRYDPLNNSTNKNVDANSFLGGIQLGANYPLTKSFSIGLNGKFLLSGYETNLKTTNASATIEHNRIYSLGIALEYSF